MTCSKYQAWSANSFTTVSDMFPMKAVASVFGTGTMIGTAGSITFARIAGLLPDHFKSGVKLKQGIIFYSYIVHSDIL